MNEKFQRVTSVSDEDILNVLKSSGKSRGLEDYPVLYTYLQETGLYPFIKSYSDCPLNQGEFVKEIEMMGSVAIFKKDDIDCKNGDLRTTFVFYKLAPGYYLEMSSNVCTLDDFEEEVQEMLKTFSNSESYAFVSYVSLLCPPPSSSLYNETFEEEIYKVIIKHRLKRNSTLPSIGMICQDDGEFYLKDFYIKNEYNLVEGDMHYGEGFMTFHYQLLRRIKEDTKGLILFHGEPGTGKTYYIRCLIKDLIFFNKFIIYLPPNMMDFMTSPEMISYISQVVMEKHEDGKSCIILLEDAEPLMQSRKSGGRTDGITNLLNMTDGLLNDMLSVQVICTFNTDIRNIDEALLRPERLVARKEFRKLTVKDSQSLAEFLKIEKMITKESTLAEIYSHKKQKEILIHEYNTDTKKMGF